MIVRDYRPGDQPAFKRLNLAWIEQLFDVEPSDLQQLDDPEGHILAPGGRVLLAELDGQTVGTVALIPAHDAPGRLELVKMSVDAGQRGKGIGRALMQAAIEAARQMGAAQIWLESNRKLDAARGLYASSGFRELSGSEFACTPYTRCDIQMQLDL
ncbi:MAG: GNAT family N-acetyltransferase [Hyphomonadaceae bacterium]|nr:GNAT family N-acetyltransferase [Hyphomonadaceae bacterium]